MKIKHVISGGIGTVAVPNWPSAAWSRVVLMAPRTPMRFVLLPGRGGLACASLLHVIIPHSRSPGMKKSIAGQQSPSRQQGGTCVSLAPTALVRYAVLELADTRIPSLDKLCCVLVWAATYPCPRVVKRGRMAMDIKPRVQYGLHFSTNNPGPRVE